MRYSMFEINAIWVTTLAALLAAMLILTGHAESGSAIAGGVVGSVAQKFAGIKPKEPCDPK